MTESPKNPAPAALPAPEDLLRFINGRQYRPMNAHDMAGELGLAEEGRRALEATLREMELRGDVVRVKKGCYTTPGRVHLIVGRLHCNPRGFGFIVPVREGAFEDAYVSAEDMGAALHDDIVAARVISRAGRRAAEVVSVVRHAQTVIVGTYEERNRFGFVAPDNSALFKDVAVAREDRGGAEPHDKVGVEITVWPSRHLPPQGRIVEVLGRKGDPGVDTRSVILEFDLPHAFDEEVAAELAELPREVSPEDAAGRLDLRGETVFTVDPEDAKDFDDAVSIAREPNGDWRLGVHIADVSHYVTPASAIGREAVRRATSVYLPGNVIPMLPEKLSNGLCSLVEGRDRLTKSALMRFDAEGRPLGGELRHSVIRSVKRLNYGQLLEILERRVPGASEGHAPSWPEHGRDGARPSEDEVARPLARGIPEKVVAAARLMGELAALLRARRVERGMLELDMPEARLRLDGEGRIAAVTIERGDAAHRLIEDFMLAANEAVAEHLARRGLPAIARVHDAPDPADLAALERTVGGLMTEGGGRKQNAECKMQNGRRAGRPCRVPLGAETGASGSGRAMLQHLLRAAQGRPGGHAVALLVLRSLKRAEYRAAWSPHYGLAAELYTHFTSPIRRLPDLLVHALLDADLRAPHGARPRLPEWTDNLPEWMRHSSFAERRGDDAERQLRKIKTLEHLKTFPPEHAFDGVIIGVEEYGLWVELSDYLIDGLVRVSTLTDAFYRLDRTGTRLQSARGAFLLGQAVKVRIESIDDLKRQINFRFAGAKERLRRR